MRVFKRKPPAQVDRRRPENAEKRQAIDQLKFLHEVAEKMVVEHIQADTSKRAEELSPRLAHLAKASRILRRS